MAYEDRDGKACYPFKDTTTKGFKLNWMNLRDAETGTILWQTNKHLSLKGEDEHVARVPASILNCSTVSREINFSSTELINNFKIRQRVLLHGQPVEEWNFAFGFVIPESTNTWQALMEAKPNIKSAEVLSGNIVIITKFYDDDEIIGVCKIRVYYV